MTDPATRQLLEAATGLLEIGRTIDRLSGPLTILAFAGLLAPFAVPVPMASLAALLLAGLGGLGAAYAGARVAFDASLFRSLVSPAADLALLDTALMQLGLMPAHKAGRALPERLAGAQGLLKRQAVLLAVQAAALPVAGLLAR